MSDPADSARANAIAMEAKKDGMAQRQDGHWRLCFTVAAADIDGRIVSAPMGTRYQAVLVEINDDETPVDHQAIDRDKWRALGPTRQAAIRCKDPIFWAYLHEELHFPPVDSEDFAATIIREQCRIDSRADLEKVGNSLARRHWHMIDYGFQAWRSKENG
jgi:hypothetical protein